MKGHRIHHHHSFVLFLSIYFGVVALTGLFEVSAAQTHLCFSFLSY